MINNMKRRLVIRVQSYNIFLFYEILWKNFVNQNFTEFGVKVKAASALLQLNGDGRCAGHRPYAVAADDIGGE